MCCSSCAGGAGRAGPGRQPIGLGAGLGLSKHPLLRTVFKPAHPYISVPSLKIISDNLTEWEWALFAGTWGGPLRPSPVVMECYGANRECGGQP